MTSLDDSTAYDAVTAELDGDEATIHVGGPASAVKLGAFLDAAIATGCLSVALDLHALDVIDPAEIAVVANARHRLASLGGALTIRAASTAVLEVLEAGGPGVPVDHLQRDQDRLLGPVQPVRQPRNGVTITTNGGRALPRRVTFVPAGDDLVDSALRLVVGLARDTVGGADGVSVSIRRHGRLATVAASDHTVLDMDAGQYATGEGPCVDASVRGRWFHAGALESETRWPAFTPRARALGINAILSSPLLAGERAVGALNIYSRTAGAFTPEGQQLAARFAEETSNVLDDAGADVTDDRLASRLREALRARRTIAQAEGVLMERDQIGEVSAYALLRRYAIESGRPLRERAEDVVSSAGEHQPDAGRRTRRNRSG
ncbi:MAG: ANTAR domain-containing protein [Acidimicrobiales bacterium]